MLNLSFYRNLSKTLAFVFVFLVTAQSVQAKSKKGIDPSILHMVQKLSGNPELMNVNYLQYIIGYPENGRVQAGHLKRSYKWYEEPSRFLRFRMDQEGPNLNVVTKSAMTINVQNSNIKLKDVESVFGKIHKTVYDWQSNPTEIYQVSPDTYLAFVQPRNTFRIQSIKVVYQGAPLPEPSLENMQRAYEYRKSQALLAAQDGQWHLAIPWLRADVAKEPANPENHLKLAFAYRQHMMINEAIGEYVETLKLSQDNPEITSQAIAALTEMRVWPIDMPSNQQQNSYIAGTNTELGL